MRVELRLSEAVWAINKSTSCTSCPCSNLLLAVDTVLKHVTCMCTLEHTEACNMHTAQHIRECSIYVNAAYM